MGATSHKSGPHLIRRAIIPSPEKQIGIQVIPLLAINLLYSGRLFHCYMLDESICHFRGIQSILSLSFLIENLDRKKCRP